MTIEAPSSDSDLLDLLRVAGPLGVSDMADATDVTPTAVRQRLTRLLAKGIIQREAIRAGRGRPKHLYQLTDKGLRLTGSNFADLALVLWQEITQIEDETLRQQMVQRVTKRLAAKYAEHVQGTTPAERMRSLGELFSHWRIPVSVEESPAGPVLTAHACPYPSLAEQDCSICVMERALFSELIGGNVVLDGPHRQGGTHSPSEHSCRFHTR
ncbi:MAG TPA: winged helix-turn-helix transcriptional regulator [Thermoguttaceae bacterium]|nr:winged helix-turn-helix transcriptional regulator [Thermoguttaceae bacterium]